MGCWVSPASSGGRVSRPVQRWMQLRRRLNTNHERPRCDLALRGCGTLTLRQVTASLGGVPGFRVLTWGVSDQVEDPWWWWWW